MPKRKHKEDISAIEKKLRKLEKKIRKQQRRRNISSSDDDETAPAPLLTPPLPPPTTPPLVSINLEDEPNHQDVGNTSLEQSSQVIASSATTLPPPPPQPAPSNLDLPAPDIIDVDEQLDIPEFELNTEILDILGDDPTVTAQYGADIHKELAARFQHIAVNGLDKEIRKELCTKYLVPGNCRKIGAPSLNAEIKIALSESINKRDKGIEARQKQIAAAISCLAEELTKQLLEKTKNHGVIKALTDASKLLCDIQHNESTTRRNFALYAVKPEMKEALSNTKIDNSLFGEDLSESLKTAKAVSKSGSELKVPTQISMGNKTRYKPLNWKAPAGARAQPPVPRRNAPYPYSRPMTTATAAPRRYGGPAPPPPPPPPPAYKRPYHGSSSKPPQHLHRPTQR